MANLISDADLATWKSGADIGKLNSHAMLVPLTPEERYTVVEEAKLRMAYHAGWNFSGAVSQAVADIRRGQTPCLDRWREEMAAREAAEAPEKAATDEQELFDEVWEAEQLVRGEKTSVVFGSTPEMRARAVVNLKTAEKALDEALNKLFAAGMDVAKRYGDWRQEILNRA